MKTLRICLVASMLAGAFLFNPHVARSTTILDQSPETVGGTRSAGLFNDSASQNFGELMSLSQTTLLTGMDVYEDIRNPPSAVVGDSVTIRVWADSAGTPGDLLHELVELVSIVDLDGVGTFENTKRVHADFTSPLSLGPGTYWTGMSGTGYSLPIFNIWGSSAPGLDGKMAQFNGADDFIQFPNVPVDSALRVYGSAVPEPSTLTLLLLGLLGLLECGRQRRRPTA